MYYDKQNFSSTEEVNKELDKIREEYNTKEQELTDIIQSLCEHKNKTQNNTLTYLSKIDGTNENYFYCYECDKYFKEGEA